MAEFRVRSERNSNQWWVYNDVTRQFTSMDRYNMGKNGAGYSLPIHKMQTKEAIEKKVDRFGAPQDLVDADPSATWKGFNKSGMDWAAAKPAVDTITEPQETQEERVQNDEEEPTEEEPAEDSDSDNKNGNSEGGNQEGEREGEPEGVGEGSEEARPKGAAKGLGDGAKAAEGAEAGASAVAEGAAATEAAGAAAGAAAAGGATVATEAAVAGGVTVGFAWWLVIIIVAIFIILAVLAAIFYGKKDDESNAAGQVFPKICVDPGHPSSTSGASGEKEINFTVGTELKTALEAKGYPVFITKTSATQLVQNQDRANSCAAEGGKYMIALHGDDTGKDTDFPYFIYANKKRTATYEQSKKDAEIVRKGLLDTLNSAGYLGQDLMGKANCEENVCTDAQDLGVFVGGENNKLSVDIIEMVHLKSSHSWLDDTTHRAKFIEGLVAGISAAYPPTAGGTTSGLCSTLLPPDPASSKGFVPLPANPQLYNINGGSPADQRWGSPELVALLNSVAKAWLAKHPGNKITIGDLSMSDGRKFGSHSSHRAGLDVDITSHGNPSFIMTDSNYDRNLSIEFGKLLIDTKAVVTIYYNDDAVQKAVTDYAKSKGLPSVMKYWDSHYNHYHLRIQPSAYANTCAFTESSAGIYGDNWLKNLGQFKDFE